MKRVGIIALLHESNTFLNQPTTLEHFKSNLLATGDDVLRAFRGTPHEVGGFLQALAENSDFLPVGIFAARAMPYGTITAECWSQLTQQLLNSLLAAGKLDGLLVAPHGATVAENAADDDGHWLQLVRQHVGPDIPIVGTLDLHANVSPQMVKACDALFGYRTNPHLDQLARGLEAGYCLMQTLKTGIKPAMALRQLPLCVNIERQATTETHGQMLWQEADRLQSQPDMLSVSCLYGFPYSDVPEMGASVIAVARQNAALAENTADNMAAFWWSRRSDFLGQLISVEQGITLAKQARELEPHKPVGLLEMGDNVGGGSPGDGTWIAHGWKQFGLGPCLAILADPAAVSQAAAAGIGARLPLEVGGHLDPVRHGPPLADHWTVVGLTDGRFSESQPRHGGYSHFNQGPTAVLRGDTGLTVVATTLRVAPLSLQQILSQNLQPADFAAIILKGVHAPVAAYEPVCSRLIRINTTGVTTADLAELTFQNRRKPLYPWEHPNDGQD
ncbi:MAG: M81 family metallopeptidase [Planctomycetaceae bacterium]